MMLQRAAAECQNIMEEVEKIEADMLTRISIVDRELASFQKLGQEILERASQNNNQISEADMRLISRLCQIGTRAPTREFAKRSLELAEELATQPISSRLRQAAQITINDFRETINTQGGAYVQGSVTVTDTARFIGRDLK
jgi:hypothetical protein